MIYLIGDTHGTIDYASVMSLRDKARYGHIAMSPEKDYVVVLGDWGIIWDQVPTRREDKLLKQWSQFPWTTLVVDGNHENFSRLFAYPEVPFGGNAARKITDRVFNLKRGSIYQIDGHKVFIFGGGLSIDKAERQEWISWWAAELPTHAETEHGLAELEKHQNSVDFIWTHAAPSHLIPWIFKGKQSEKQHSCLARYFDHLYEIVDFKKWFCGHYHVDTIVPHEERLIVIYRDIYQITESGTVLLCEYSPH